MWVTWLSARSSSFSILVRMLRSVWWSMRAISISSVTVSVSLSSRSR